jgi:TolA-binding protein
MAAFRRGDYAAADRSLAEFSRQAPHDPRAEDATFIRAVARSRLGDARGAAALARNYLTRYPNGLRRSEAERIVRAAP